MILQAAGASATESATGARIVEAHAVVSRPAAEPGDAPAPGASAFRAGDRAVLTLEVTHEGGAVAWPDRVGLQEALAARATVLGDGRDVAPSPSELGATSAARAWDVQLLLPPGEGELGPVSLALTAPDGAELDRIEIPSVRVSVETVLPEELAASLTEQQDPAALREQAMQALAPVRGPWSVASPIPWMLLGLGLLAALIVAALAWWLWKRRGRKVATAEALPLEAPEVRARRRVEALRASGVLEAGGYREFHVEVADILKCYLGERLHEDFLDRTTHEVRQLLGSKLESAWGMARARPVVLSVLSACDLVKFAKHVPRSSEASGVLDDVTSIVDLTTPLPLPAPGESPQRADLEGAA